MPKRPAIQSHEWFAVGVAFAYFFCVLAAYYMIRPVRDQLSEALVNGRVNDGLSVSLQQYRMSLAGLGVYRAHVGLAMRGFDLLLCPSAPGEAPEGLAATGAATFNGLWTSLYLPCITLPLFSGPKGLPIGLQLVGHYGQDPRLIAGAAAVQATLT